jgi:N-methylhydantoinase B
MTADPVKLEIFKHLFSSVAEEMGATLGRTGYSPNINERRDFSCALFLGDGRLLAQAAHIPVHLGAMPASVEAAIKHIDSFAAGDMVMLNDPYLGGTHLPDVTLISPIFLYEQDTPSFYVASRAHHADVGGMTPGSMPLSTELYQEGLIIPPVKLVESGQINEGVLALFLRNSRNPDERQGDLAAQQASHRVGERRLRELLDRYGYDEIVVQAETLIQYTEIMVRSLIHSIPNGAYEFTDHLDNDGITSDPVIIRCVVTIADESAIFDFTGSSAAVRGSVNAVPAIVQSAIGYVLHCLAGEALPANHGLFSSVRVIIPEGSVLDPGLPHAVAGGNVETSMRLVDVIYGALAQVLPEWIPAASQGTMNNISFGGIHPRTGQPFAYYETLAGGSGAASQNNGASAIHCHMTNTLNTPVEALEMALPVRIWRYQVRRKSGGKGLHQGGDGIEREYEFMAPVRVTLLTDRRRFQPYGLKGGDAGKAGENELIIAVAGKRKKLSGKISLDLKEGDRLVIKTPGGGGWGRTSRSK